MNEANPARMPAGPARVHRPGGLLAELGAIRLSKTGERAGKARPGKMVADELPLAGVGFL